MYERQPAFPNHSEPEPAHGARVLLLAGNTSPRLAELLPEARGQVTHSADPLEAVGLLRGGDFDLALIQLPAPGWSAEEIIEQFHRNAPRVPLILIDSEGANPAAWARWIRSGAFHCLPLPVEPSEVRAAMAAAIEHRGRLTGLPTDRLEAWQRLLVGESPALRNVVDTVRLIGSRRCTVLITGETGTGKEMAARAIHLAGSRASMPMVAVNCSALPEQLLEAELFGHVRGAFTGAVNQRVGRFEQAHRGTLFLDEIGDLPFELQAKLLRVLQEREFQRLGSSETVKVDVRVIAASNFDLAERVKQGKFREDLYYRINVVPIHMPTLRERASDIPLLVHHFLEKICRHEDIPLRQATPETLERLARCPWPGNVRQLENAVEMAVALSGDRCWLYPGDFRLPSAAPSPAPGTLPPARWTLPEEGIDFESTVGALEQDLLQQALRRSGGNKKLAADLLRLKRTTLAAKLKSFESLAVA